MNQVTEMEPGFVRGQVVLAQSDAWIHQQWDRSPERAERARAGATKALRLAPEWAGSHVAMGTVSYRIDKDYDSATRHLGHARDRDPGNRYPVEIMGYTSRRAGEWDAAVADLEDAREMRSTRALEWELGGAYQWMGRYDEAREAFERAQALQPDHNQPKVALAWLDIDEHGDLTALRGFLGEIETGHIGNRWFVAMVDEDWDAALTALERTGPDPLQSQYSMTPRALARGLTFQRMGDETRARDSYQEAREMVEAFIDGRPDDPRGHLALGLALAGLGEGDAAVAQGQRGVELMSPERDAMTGAHSLLQLAEIQSMAGHSEDALGTLKRARAAPCPRGTSAIAMDPWLHDLEGNPRFHATLGMS